MKLETDRADDLLDSSSSESSDEEALQQVQQGFIVDDDEPIKKKRRKDRLATIIDDKLDDDDLQLVLENSGKSKKLNRIVEVNNIFEDLPPILDDFDDFIEDDDDNEPDLPINKPDFTNLSVIDREALQQLFEVFGNGTEYDWALPLDEPFINPISLDEVFEHSELKQRMLTNNDNLIRMIDIPERYQKFRKSLNYLNVNLLNELIWIGNILFKEKSISPNLKNPFFNSIKNVINFISNDYFEVPFIWTHRRDFLLYSDPITNEIHKLLFEDDLWRIIYLDIEYHSIYEKKLNIEKIIKSLNHNDEILKNISTIDSMIEIQDIYDYINFNYSSQLNKKKFNLFNKIKSNIIYDGIKAFGISSKKFGDNVQDQSLSNFLNSYRIHPTDDPIESPKDIVERLIQDDDSLYKNSKITLEVIRKIYSEEIFYNPKIRFEVRSTFKKFSLINFILTDKGKLLIDNNSIYYDLKYAINRSPSDLVNSPNIFLRMLEAESLGLAIIKIEIKDYNQWFNCIFKCLKSDGTSDLTDLWNNERKLVLNLAFKKLCDMVALNIKEDLRKECQRLLLNEIRRKFLLKIDQAPFTPFGFDKGIKSNVLALSFGKGDYNSAVVGVLIKDSGKVDNYFKSDNNPIQNLEQEDLFNNQLKEFFNKNLQFLKPDVIVISGFNANSKKLFDIIKKFVEQNNINSNIDELPDIENAPLIPVIWGQDETARLYQNSESAKRDFADKPTLIKYCIGLGRYVQNPLLEYVSLGDDILSLNFFEHQKLIPNDMILESIESVYVDIINMVGIDINEAVRNPYIAQLLPYIAGLGPRKASGLIRNINNKLGSTLVNRSDLIESELTLANIFINCSSFLNIPYEDSTIRDSSVELLDATRIHPEDYDLARKMAADALDLDEEDLAHVEEEGGTIYQLMKEGVSKVDDLNLIAYGNELENKFGKKKYATLQIIKEELVNNFEELRRSFHILENSEVFQMLTGETSETFSRNIIVPVTVVKVGKNFEDYQQPRIRFAKVVTSSLISGNVEEKHIPHGLDLNQGDVVQAVVLEVFYDSFTANFSLADSDIKRAIMPRFIKERGKWDFQAEEEDWKKEKAKERIALAKTRNIQHPLYHNFNFKQAEEFLAPQSVGDCVIRPSSKGSKFLTVTWKVANNLFQHLLVEEKISDGIKEYLVDRKRYADLDQLIFQHIQAIAKKVNEMTKNNKFREGTLKEVNEWLESYTKANPKSSAYVFCFDHKSPGSFLLLFKVNMNTPVSTWHVRTEVDGYNLKGFSYPNMLSLCNGFKQTFKSFVSNSKSRPPQRSQQANYSAW